MHIGYVISDKGNYVILDNKVIAQTMDNYRRIKMLKADAFDWKQVTEYVEPKPKKPIVVTVEILAKEGEKKLEAPVAEATGEGQSKKVN